MGPFDTASVRSASTAAGRATIKAGGVPGSVYPESSGVSLKSDVTTDAPGNPFTLPSDEDILTLREEDKRRKAETRKMIRTAPVHAKTTFASRMQGIMSGDELNLGTTKSPFRDLKPTLPTSGGDASLAEAAGAPPRRRQKEDMTEFIAKKREIFLVQMSLDTKRAEIRKLEERARQREEALKKSEQMLEEDALRFDAFLKENDEKVQEAIKRAEVEAKAKQDKVTEIKRLNTVIAALRSEMNKYEEQLEDCKKYKEFLEKITPADWAYQEAQKLQARKDARLQQWREECDALRALKEAAQAQRNRADHEFANARTQQEAERAERDIKEAAERLKEVLKHKEPPQPDVEAEFAKNDQQDMYFKEPQQLLAVYAQLEESNLFLIQNSQESEEALEEVKVKYRDTKLRLDAEVAALQTQMHHLESAIAAARDKSQRLRDRTYAHMGQLTLGGGSGGSGGVGSGAAGGNAAASSSGQGAGVSLDQLGAKVTEVYVRCGFDADASMSTLQMLSNLESRLEEQLTFIATLPPEHVEAAEKAREKDRRQHAREEKIEASLAEHEARVQRALQRAAAPVFKRTGKREMLRSTLVKKRVEVEQDEHDNEEAELEAFLAKDML